MSTMKQQRNQSGSALVYSTEAGGRMCPDCGEPVAQCRCKELKARLPATDGIVRVSHETKGRKGKGVTVVKGVALDAAALTALGKQLKTACGSGGTVKDGVIEIQGEHRETVIAALVKQGHTVKRAGG
jgi:translation initiation factor 1